ncbi:two-component regulator propeller domain-containing protein [Sphingobacterium thalpophilum]|uniref:sensor histidine kinase n=1 Tax=Sphingobacterium thalpophilum TaxID=259 RepID=UPI002D79FE6D|nr:two-component regulator propeller domain-containing protein [Sphingobacterium thalpophilum]
MMTSKKFALFLASLLTLLPLMLKAMEISFNRITDGLASNFVNCVTQTADGFIWVGTKNGLQRYDGIRFRRLLSPGLPGLPVDQLLVSQKSKSLLVRMEHTFFLLNPQTNKAQEVKVDQYTKDFQNYQIRLVQQAGQIFLILHGVDILILNESTNKFESSSNTIGFPANWGPTWLQYDGTGIFWIAGLQGMGYFDSNKKTFFTNNKLSSVKNINRFYRDSRGRVFIQIKKRHTNGLIYLADTNFENKKLIPSEPNSRSNYHDFYECVEFGNIIWAYGVDIFNLFDEDKKKFVQFYDQKNTDYGIQVTTVSQVFRDRDQNVWVATDNGLYIMSIIGDHVRNIVTSGIFEKAAITDLTSFGPDGIMVGSWGEKLTTIKYNDALKVNLEPKVSDILYNGAPTQDLNFRHIWSIEYDQKTGNSWIGCKNGRLIFFDAKTRRSQFLVPKIFGGQSIRRISVHPNGQIWFGTDNGKIIRKENSGYTILNDLKSSVSCIRPGNGNDVWVGTRGSGVFQLEASSGKIIKNYKSGPHGLTTSKIQSIELIGDRLLAIAGYSGLDILNLHTGEVTKYNIGNGLPQNMVTALVTDNEGLLWMSTTAGICRFDPGKREFRSFNKRHGLVNTSNVANLLTCGVKLASGKLAFSSDKAVLIFDPSKFNRNNSAPKELHITDFKLFDKYLSVDSLIRAGGVTLEHWQNFFSIFYSTLSYNDPDSFKYYYRLEGSGKSWIPSDPQLATNFASLSPGKYVFMVRSESQGGKFSAITKLPITIKPAFYQTWWFFAIIALFILSSIFILHRYRLKRLLEVHRLREKVARDLHDDVGSTLTSIHILSEVAKKDLSEQHHIVRSYLDRIGANSSQMMQAMDDIVWSIKPDNDLLQKIVARMREHAALILDPLKIQYVFQADDSIRNIKLDMEQRRHLFLIYKEALNNISKYAEATSVLINIGAGPSHIELQIKDNGKGFDCSRQHSGNGLYNMAQRSQALGAQFSITSSENRGTTVLLTLKI